MKDIPSSLFLGPLFLITFFLASVVIVAGIKILYLYFKREPVKLKPERVRKPKIVKPAPPQKPIRSIEINPDEVDKIYVKKIS